MVTFSINTYQEGKAVEVYAYLSYCLALCLDKPILVALFEDWGLQVVHSLPVEEFLELRST